MNDAKDWHVLTKTHGGTVSILQNMDEHAGLVAVIRVSNGKSEVVEYITEEESHYREMEESTAEYWRREIDKRW